MENWAALFREHILERGYQYFKLGAVSEVSKTTDGYTAIVKGTENYTVKIALQGGTISEAYCDCPYAEDGSHCKHMAALLYWLENEKETSETEVGADKGQAVEQLLNELTEVAVKRFLLDLANEDSSIKNKIIATFSKSIGKNEVEQLKGEVDAIVYRYAGREGFIYYREASDFVNEMEAFLYQKGQALIANKCNMQAFEVVAYVFKIVSNQDMDDSDGDIGNVANLCYELWEQIVEQCNADEKEAVFQWFQSHQEGYVVDFMEEFLSDFLINHFHDPKSLLEKLKILDERIAAAGAKTDCGASWSVRYDHQNNILKRLEIMKRLGLSEKEINEYRKRFRNFSAVRKLEIGECIEKKDYDGAIALLIESKKLDKEYPGLVSGYSIMLIEIYAKLNLGEQYKQELMYQVFTCRQDNLQNVKKLKQCYPEEWEDMLEKLLREPCVQPIKYQLLEEERMYRRLLDEILKSGFIYSLDQYENCLKKQFPNEVRDAYIKYTILSAEATTDRKAYKGLIVYLKKIWKYPQGEKAVLEIANDWRERYKRRPAMMDELQKAGF